MSVSTIRPILLATAFALAGCGGGGGGGLASIPPPPVTPTPTPAPPPAIIPAGTTSQQFTVMGASRSFDGDQTALLGAADQLQVRYVQSSNSYEVQLPDSQAWEGIRSVAGSSNNFEGAVALTIRGPLNTQYSSLFSWSDGATFFGYEAIGMATPAGSVPVTGNATYSGSIGGSTSESYLDRPVSIFGGIQLSFDFGRGSLSGSVHPEFFSYATYDDYTGTPISFRDTVYSTGSTTFSGKFDTNLPGVNSFSGLFTGPNAQELIGNFALPYRSPIDGQNYQADGAFVGAK
jgi:hypothetical protein